MLNAAKIKYKKYKKILTPSCPPPDPLQVTFESFIESLGSLVDLILVVVVQYYIFAVVAMNL